MTRIKARREPREPRGLVEYGQGGELAVQDSSTEFESACVFTLVTPLPVFRCDRR